LGIQQQSLQQLQADYRRRVLDIGTRLQELDRAEVVGDSATAAAAIQAVQQAVYTHLYCLASLLKVDRCDLAMALLACGDRELDQSVDSGPALAAYQAAVQVVNLTPQQRQQLTEQFKICQQILQPVLHQRQQLHQQLNLMTLASGAGAAACTALGPGYQDKDLEAALLRQQQQLGLWHQQQQQQQQLHAQLRAVLRKEYLLQAAADSCMMSCLTWVQVGRLAVLTYPAPVQASHLARALLLQTPTRQHAAQCSCTGSALTAPCQPASHNGITSFLCLSAGFHELPNVDCGLLSWG